MNINLGFGIDRESCFLLPTVEVSSYPEYSQFVITLYWLFFGCGVLFTKGSEE